MRDRLCREPAYPRELWFSRAGRRTEMAKTIRAACLVRRECLDYALTEGIEAGVWGGKSEKERQGCDGPRRSPRKVRGRSGNAGNCENYRDVFSQVIGEMAALAQATKRCRKFVF
jgi:hypothetical protein